MKALRGYAPSPAFSSALEEFSLLRRHRLSIIGQNFLQAKNDFLKYVNYEMSAEEARKNYKLCPEEKCVGGGGLRTPPNNSTFSLFGSLSYFSTSSSRFFLSHEF
jgi:hypothetical protein